MSWLWNWLKSLFASKTNSGGSPTPSEQPKPEPKKPRAWMAIIRKYLGAKETDSWFSKFMVPKWSLFGMDLGTIAQSWTAWCGLMVAVALSMAGLEYAKDGALARNWAKYGQKIEWRVDGIPEGAIVHINHKFDCSSSSSNHVAFANGDCTAADLLKPGATIDLLGGNQNNQVKVSTYPVKEVCNVRWPPEEVKPGRVTKSINCTSKKTGTESTR